MALGNSRSEPSANNRERERESKCQVRKRESVSEEKVSTQGPIDWLPGSCGAVRWRWGRWHIKCRGDHFGSFMSRGDGICVCGGAGGTSDRSMCSADPLHHCSNGSEWTSIKPEWKRGREKDRREGERQRDRARGEGERDREESERERERKRGERDRVRGAEGESERKERKETDRGREKAERERERDREVRERGERGGETYRDSKRERNEKGDREREKEKRARETEKKSEREKELWTHLECVVVITVDVVEAGRGGRRRVVRAAHHLRALARVERVHHHLLRTCRGSHV